MPNTLAHIGLQTPLTKIGLRKSPLQWIALGCIIPDIPWIVQRIFIYSPGIDPISLRLYAITQASLLYCCILSLAFALLTRKSGFIFLILAFNSVLHLLFDACQTKWGNGVNFLVPFSWQTVNFGLFWPEHSISYLFTIMGVATLLFCWPKAAGSELFLQRPGKIKALVLALSLLIYFASPPFLITTARNADTHYSKTLLTKGERKEKKIEIDRGNYNGDTKTLGCYTGETLLLSNPPGTASAIVSIRGTFDGEESVTVTEYHTHKSHRDYASYAGLCFTLLLWLHTIIRTKNNAVHRSS